MEKICRRCQFRTLQTRTTCHVCGHDKFNQIAVSQTAGDEAVRLLQSAMAAPEATLATQLSSVVARVSDARRKTVYSVKGKVDQVVSALGALKLNSKLVAEEPSQTASNLLKSRQQPSASKVSANVQQLPAQSSNTKKRETASVKLSKSSKALTVDHAQFDLQTSFAPSIVPDTLAEQQAVLQQLLEWFRSYGTQNLILPSGVQRDDLTAFASDVDKAA